MLNNTYALHTGNRRKLAARKALFISLIFHLFLFITTFYVAVQNHLITSEKAHLAVELISEENTPRPKPQPKKISLRFSPPTREMVAPVPSNASAVESLPSSAAPVSVSTEVARPTLGRSLQAELEIEKPSESLDIRGEISTATRELQDIKGNLSKTEAASPAGNKTFGAKRPGPPRIQRMPELATIKMIEEEVTLSPMEMAEIEQKRKALPQVSLPEIMQKLAQEIVETSAGGPIDVVFVIDTSGSMLDNIKSVIKHLKQMVDVYEASEIDYALGVTEFRASKDKNRIKVVQLTKSFTEYKRTLQRIRVNDDENALDAVLQTVKEMRFRPTSQRHFVLVTDEPFTSLHRMDLQDVIEYCREFGVFVNVLGIPLDSHQKLAAETGGKWHAIPQEGQPQVVQQAPVQKAQRDKASSLRHAQWTDVKKIGANLLQHSSGMPIDIILFVDSSKSMGNKLSHFLQQLDVIIRDCDNAFIDYQIGVVRFRSRGSVNIVNVFDPPQTLKQIRKIVQLPCQADEMLLDAVADGLRRLKLRSNAQAYFILITDEPAKGEYSSPAIIQMLRQKHVLVSVVGTYDDFQRQVANQTGGVWVPIPKGHTTSSLFW